MTIFFRNKIWITLIAIIFLAFTSCKSEKKSSFKFIIPKITSENRYDSVILNNKTELDGSGIIFFDKYLFSKEIQLSNKTRHSVNFQNDLLRLDINEHLKQELYKDLGFDGLQLLFYSNSFRFNLFNEINDKGIFKYDTKKYGLEYYPLFIFNENQRAKLLDGKDGYVYCIQEAQDYNNIWYPIETLVSDFCGNGRWNLIIRPNEFALILLPKYTGNFKTKIRARLKNSNCIYTSNPIDGYINYNQFYFDKETIKNYNRSNDKSIIGSIPKDFSD